MSDRITQPPASSVVRIEIEWSDGTIERATGDEAHAAWAALVNCLGVADVHGCGYRGSKLRVVEARDTSTPFQYENGLVRSARVFLPAIDEGRNRGESGAGMEGQGKQGG